MALNRGLLTSHKKDWETPPELFQSLNKEFGFDLDVCATSANTKCLRFFSPEDDGLRQDWHGTCWMNPPYGRTIGLWMAKAYQASLKGATIVCLVPARTDTEWWHRFATKGEIRFLKGRLKFVGAKAPAPFPSAIVVFRPKPLKQKIFKIPERDTLTREAPSSPLLASEKEGPSQGVAGSASMAWNLLEHKAYDHGTTSTYRMASE